MKFAALLLVALASSSASASTEDDDTAAEIRALCRESRASCRFMFGVLRRELHVTPVVVVKRWPPMPPPRPYFPDLPSRKP